ncbi:purine-cytosine permease family protein [Paralysiella testudinis]|uniref:Allantoin permease n=1 Tax=Paralysiella testudinis TaxID=2809020 RepID=A0A892ZG73_9NEIS|nr:allantoin permease [Paralysiella testudinis]QRQ82111.1 allantoin permease [Paralysiella testudinis]
MAGVMQPQHNGAPDDTVSDVSTEIVSEHDRASKGSLTMAWWGVCSAMFYIVVGIAMAKAYGTVNAIIGLGITVVAYGIVNGIISRYAISTGLSVGLFSRVLFGAKGAALATLIFFVTAIYYAVFEGSVIAVTLNHMYPGISYTIAALIVVLYSVPLIFGSVQHWLDKFNGVLLPFYILGLVGAVVLATSQYGYTDAWLRMGPENPSPTGWWNVCVYYMGVWILMMFTFDYARFGKKEDSKYHALFNFGIPFYMLAFFLSGLAGIYLVNTIPHEGDVSEVSIAFGLIELMGIFGLLFVWITQTRINTANYFLATTNMQAFFKDVFKLNLNKMVWAVVVGIIVYLLMLINVFAYLLQALAYQGVFVVAWVAIALTHILHPRRKQIFGEVPQIRSAKLPAFDASGLTAWLVASAVGIVLMNLGGSWTNWYATITFFTAAILYALLMPKQRQKLLP